MMNIEDMADTTMKAAYKNASRSELVPAFFIVDADEKMMIMAVPHYSDNKDAHIAMLREAVKERRAEFFMVVMEAWMSMPKDKSPVPKVRPRDDPDRISAIILSGQHRDGRQVFRVSEIIEPKDGKFEGRKFKASDVSETGYRMSLFDNVFGDLGKPS